MHGSVYTHRGLCTWGAAGVISKAEFHEFINKELGVRGNKQGDIGGLFKSLDADGSGELDLIELKVALKRLQDAAAVANDEEDTRAAVVTRTTRAAKAAQEAALKASAALEAVETASAAVDLEAAIEADTAAAKAKSPKHRTAKARAEPKK